VNIGFSTVILHYTRLSKSRLQRQRRPRSTLFVSNARENREHTAACPQANRPSASLPLQSRDQWSYRDIFEFRHISPRVHMQLDPRQSSHGILNVLESRIESLNTMSKIVV